jgi:hypothetical protein
MTTTCMVRVAAMATLAIGLALPCGAGAQASSEVKAQVREVSTAIVAEQLGSKASPLQAADLVVGTVVGSTGRPPSEYRGRALPASVDRSPSQAGRRRFESGRPLLVTRLILIRYDERRERVLSAFVIGAHNFANSPRGRIHFVALESVRATSANPRARDYRARQDFWSFGLLIHQTSRVRVSMTRD